MKTSRLQPHLRIGLDDTHQVHYAILPGDPARVDRVMQHLDDSSILASNREFKSAIGTYKGTKVLVVSTGIGGASMGIAVEELKNIGVTTLIRIGSCGALQAGMKLGDLVVASGAVRSDGASKAYIDSSFPAVAHSELFVHAINTLNARKYTYHTGIIRSHDSFYTDEEASIDQFWSQKGVLASDMETAALYVIGALRHLKTLSILNVVVEHSSDLEDNINDYVDGNEAVMRGETSEIQTALDIIHFFKN